MGCKTRETNFLYNFTEINNLEEMEIELKEFKDTVNKVRTAGCLKTTEFEHKLLKRALDEGPERLIQAVQQITPIGEQKKLMRLAKQGGKFLPYINPDEVLSEWAKKQINRYIVKGKLTCECEVKIKETVRTMTESFIINTMIKAACDEGAWGALVEHLKQNFISLNGIEEHLC